MGAKIDRFIYIYPNLAAYCCYKAKCIFAARFAVCLPHQYRTEPGKIVQSSSILIIMRFSWKCKNLAKSLRKIFFCENIFSVFFLEVSYGFYCMVYNITFDFVMNKIKTAHVRTYVPDFWYIQWKKNHPYFFVCFQLIFLRLSSFFGIFILFSFGVDTKLDGVFCLFLFIRVDLT